MTSPTDAGELMAALMWPPDAEPRFGPADGITAGRREVCRYRVRPDLGRATIFLPSGRAGAVTLRRLAAQNSQLARLARLAAIPAARVGALMHLSGATVSLTVSSSADPATSLVAELGRRLGTELAAVVYLGPPRPNRKPVLQLVDRRGRAVAWAKLAPNELTRRLVGTEADALELIASSGRTTVLRAARFLDRFEWPGAEVLVFDPLPPAWIRARGGEEQLVDAALVDIARLIEPTTSSIGESQWSSSLTDRLEGAGADGVVASFEQLAAVRTEELSFGCWHGDFTSWNHDVRGDRVNVWDWERFDRSVPLGLDLVHLVFQEHLQHQGASITDSASATDTSGLRARLRRLGVTPGTEDLVVSCYLFELAARYGEDRSMAVGTRYEAWCEELEEVLAERLGRLVAQRPRASEASLRADTGEGSPE